MHLARFPYNTMVSNSRSIKNGVYHDACYGAYENLFTYFIHRAVTYICSKSKE